jgi:predicted alpha-1,2-mannosidase
LTSSSPRAALVLSVVACVLFVTAGEAPAEGSRTEATVSDPASLVDPFIGTANGGHDFPGADTPFGMVQWSPDTNPRARGGGYTYSSSTISGFSLTHLAGAGCFADGDVPVLPTVGPLDPSPTVRFSHANEQATAGSYTVTLANGVRTQLSATTRTGIARFTFPPVRRAHLVLDLSGSAAGDSAVAFSVVGPKEVSGSVTSGNFCHSANRYTLYFDMRFDHAFATHGTFSGNTIAPGAEHLVATAHDAERAESTARTGIAPALLYHGPLPPGRTPMATLSRATGAYLSFDTRSNRTVTMKVGLSYVSVAGARGNLAAEDPGWNLGGISVAAHRAWNALLGRIAIAGGTRSQQRIFYTAFYHALMYPNVYSDVDGRYLGTDHVVHTVDAGHHAFYSDFSGWDIYRTQAPLEALVDPSVAADTAQSMVDDYAQDGMLPKWMMNNGESYVMVGDPADPIIATYAAFGATGFDASSALADMVAEATTANDIRPGGTYLDAPGYLPNDGSYGCCDFSAPVSTTLEYATDDFAISALAQALGRNDVRTKFLGRAQDWANLLDPASGFTQPRRSDGSWGTRFDPRSASGFAEGDSWQYTSMVPFDLGGLIAAKGGRGPTAADLDTVLRDLHGAHGYADMRNEPSFLLPWVYDFLGRSYRTQGVVRRMQTSLWADAPQGLPGQDDLGTMSAWFVWSALGMYPVTPGTGTLALGSPLFPRAVLTLASGGRLTIEGQGAWTSAPYVRSAAWNGSGWNDAFAPPRALSAGGTLLFRLGGTPNRSWASSPAAAPPSYGPSVQRPRVGPIGAGVGRRRCLDDRGSVVIDGNPVQISGCNGTAAQEWTIAGDGTVRALGKCLDVSGGGTSIGTRVDLRACTGAGSQRWLALNGALVNPRSGRCLDDPGSTTVAGTQVRIWRCNGTSAQRWRLPPPP